MDTTRVAHYYNRNAGHYDDSMRMFERWLGPEGRPWACAQARGDVLEIAIGTGRNLPFYAADVRLTGVDISEAMLAIARQRARDLGRQVELRVGDAQALDFPAGTFDTVVSTLSMCAIPDAPRAIAEAQRVLRPDGRLVLFEHVRSPNLFVRTFQRLVNPLSLRFACDDLLREPARMVAAQGLAIEQLDRLKLGIVERVVARAH
jgi:ubiquinone/menaquinone biosynthesis C-methylase UbiE